MILILKFLSVRRILFIEWIGKHALEIYVVHQPLICGILFLINYFGNKNLDYNKDTKKLDFTGFLIIKGMHNLVETDIKYNIIFE